MTPLPVWQLVNRSRCMRLNYARRCFLDEYRSVRMRHSRERSGTGQLRCRGTGGLSSQLGTTTSCDRRPTIKATVMLYTINSSLSSYHVSICCAFFSSTARSINLRAAAVHVSSLEHELTPSGAFLRYHSATRRRRRQASCSCLPTTTSNRWDGRVQVPVGHKPRTASPAQDTCRSTRCGDPDQVSSMPPI